MKIEFCGNFISVSDYTNKQNLKNFCLNISMKSKISKFEIQYLLKDTFGGVIGRCY